MRNRSKKEVAIRNAYIDGFRPYVVQSPGTVYRGCFRRSENHGYGTKVYPCQKLVYDGQWKASKRDGIGTLRTLCEDGTSKRIYIGNWSKGKRCGEGKMFHNDGVYYGFWEDDKHHGKGIKWYDNGAIYIGEWKRGLYHGAGVMFYKNGNRFEGCFENGQKHGEGLYIHSNTGQVQKGVWSKDVCKTSIMFDEFRNQVTNPTPYSILENKLHKPDEIVKRMFKEYLPKVVPKQKLSTTCEEIRMNIRLKFLANMFK